MNQASAKPLDGVSVLDVSTFVTGGFCSLMLAHLGADVLKVEPPGKGDVLRQSGPPFFSGESGYFLSCNSGKRSITLNLKSEQGRDIAYELARRSDVFLENFRPGTAQRLGVDYDAIRAVNKSIVYCSISGFGQTGPYRDRPAYDPLIQALSGVMSVTGEAGRPPVKVGVPLSDLTAAMWGAYGIASALLRREKTGLGDYLDVAMFDGVLPWLTKQAGVYFAGGQPQRLGSKDPVIAPYQVVETQDGYLNVAIGNDRLFATFCRALGREDLAQDARFATNQGRVEHRDVLDPILETIFKTRPTDAWVALLAEENHLPVSAVLSVGQALNHPQTRARGTLLNMDHPVCGPIQVLNLPLRYRHANSGFSGPPPTLGQDTECVLSELGYGSKDVETLREQGTI